MGSMWKIIFGLHDCFNLDLVDLENTFHLCVMHFWVDMLKTKFDIADI